MKKRFLVLLTLLATQVQAAQTIVFGALNFTEYNYIFGQLIDLLITIVVKLPEVAIPLIVVIVIFIIGAFIAALMKKITTIARNRF